MMVIRIFTYFLIFGILLGLGWAGSDYQGWVEFLSITAILGVYISLLLGFITKNVDQLESDQILKWMGFLSLLWIVMTAIHIVKVESYCAVSKICDNVTLGKLLITFILAIIPIGAIWAFKNMKKGENPKS